MTVSKGVSRFESQLLTEAEPEKTCRAASALPESVILDKKVVSSDADRLAEKQQLHDALKQKIARGLRRTPREHRCWENIESFYQCGQEMSCVQWCTNCDTDHAMTQRCSKKYCPLCHWKITTARQEMIHRYAEHVENPQHVVLTQRNFRDISREKMREHYRNLTRIREQKLWSGVRGGCTSIEMTNKGEGWHLHSHSLVDCKFIDVQELAVAWGKLVGQEFAIVHRNNIDAGNYAKEICKYVCKASEMIRWTTRDILNFIEAIHGTRFFFKFGNLLKDSKQIKQAIAQEKLSHSKICQSCEADNCFEFVPDKNMGVDARLRFLRRK